MNEPLVTIAIPTYRRPEYLRLAIGSALAQTWRNTDILVSDSDRDPGIHKLVESFHDPRLRYRCNALVTNATQNAMAMYRDARGEFVGTLHDDDLWEPDMLARLVSPLVADPSLVLSFCDHWIMDSHGTVLPMESGRYSAQFGRADLAPGVHKPFVREALITRAVEYAVNTVTRRSAVEWADPPDEVGVVYDRWLGWLASREGAGAYYCPERLTRYRSHLGAASATIRFEANEVYLFDRFLADPALHEFTADLAQAAARYRLSFGVSLLRSGNRSGAREQFRLAGRSGARANSCGALVLSLLPGLVARLAVNLVRQVRVVVDAARRWSRRHFRP